MANEACIFISINASSSSTIAEALEIDHLYQALQRVEQGEAEYDDYDLLEGKWDLPSVWETLLRSANYQPI